MQKSNHLFAIWGLVFGCVLFGLGSLIVAFVDIGSYAIAFWRMFIACLTFIIINFFLKQSFPRSKKAIIFGLLSGVFLAFDLSLWHESIHAVGPGISTLLNSLQIFFITAIGFFFFKERPSILQIVSLILAISGIALIAGREFDHNQNATWGFIAGIISGLFLALSMSSIRKMHEIELTALAPLMVLTNLGGAVILIPFAIFDKDGFWPKDLQSISLILVYGIILQCGAWTMIAYAINKLTLALTGLLLLSEPVAALLIDYFFLDKPIAALQWFGALITLFAIYIGTLKRKA